MVTDMRWLQRMSLKHLTMAMLAISVLSTPVGEGVVTSAGGSELRSGRSGGGGSWFSLLPSPA